MSTQNDKKKSASYAIEMMLKLSNCFQQMSAICRTAVIDFTKDLHIKQEYENIAKYRITDEPKREVISQSINSKIEEQIKIVQKIIPQKKVVVNKTRTSAPKRPLIQLSTISVPSIQKKKQQPSTSHQQQIQKKLRQKDPILKEKIQPIQGKRIVRQSSKIAPKKINSDQNQDLSQEPSDYKSRHRRKSSKNRSKSKRNRKSRTKKNTDPSKKRPLNGFINFFVEIKDEIKKKYGVSKVPQISHFASVEWKKLSANQQEKYHNYGNVQKMKEAQKNEDQMNLLEQKDKSPKKHNDRTYLKVKRHEKQERTEKIEQSSDSSDSSSSDSGSEGSDSNDENSESSSPIDSSEIKNKSKKEVIMNDKDSKAGSQFKIQLGKQ